MAQWLVHLLHKQKVGFNSQLWQSFFFPQVFSFFPFREIIRILSGPRPELAYSIECGCATVPLFSENPVNFIHWLGTEIWSGGAAKVELGADCSAIVPNLHPWTSLLFVHR